MASSPIRLPDYRHALLPILAGPVDCRQLLAEGDTTFLNFILSQDLGPLWHYTLQNAGLLEGLPPETVEPLSGSRRVAVASYLAQRAALEKLGKMFDGQDIAYAVMKGVHVRECAYPEASLRTSCDIDILVLPGKKQMAARLLVDAGYKLHADPANISHEATFSNPPVDIDLHWDIMRPGRTRIDMAAGLLDRRQRINGIWGLSDNDTLFLMLTHPAFTKYVCSPNMGLARVADFLLWIKRRQIEWPAVLRLLDQAGLKTAAWTMLAWYSMLAPEQSLALLSEWRSSVRPGKLRSAYLQYWLTHDLPSRLINQPLPIQIGFTLAMHDKMADALHALSGLRIARKTAMRDVALLVGGQDKLANG